MSHKPATIRIDRERFPIDEWRLIETRLGDDDGGLTGTLFTVGNGYLGLRADWCPDPQSAGTYVNGFHETFPIKHAEHTHTLARTGQTLLNAPDAKSIELDIGGEVLRLAPLHRVQANVSSYLRTIDFRDGVLRSELIWETTAGVRVKVVSERLVSLEHRHLAVVRLSVTALSGSAPVTITSQLVNRQDLGTDNPGGASTDPRRGRTFDHRVLEPVLQDEEPPAPGEGGTSVLGFRTAESGMLIAAAVRHVIDGVDGATITTELAPDRATTTIRIDLGEGDTTTVTKYVAYHAAGQIPLDPDASTIGDLAGGCRDTLDSAVRGGWAQAESEQRGWLEQFWEPQRRRVVGDDPGPAGDAMEPVPAGPGERRRPRSTASPPRG